jgi:hypothetical protein
MAPGNDMLCDFREGGMGEGKVGGGVGGRRGGAGEEGEWTSVLCSPYHTLLNRYTGYYSRHESH